MSKNIEVEIRGNLTGPEYDALKAYLEKNATHVESHEREMYLLQDYNGYTKDFVGREVDIRLRKTNGSCEIMYKRKVGDAREEISLQLNDSDLENAKKVVKALGCKKALWMNRLKEVYVLNGVEWSLVKAPPSEIMYWEAEIAIDDPAQVDATRMQIAAEAEKLHLQVLDDDATRNLIDRLGTEANKVLDL